MNPPLGIEQVRPRKGIAAFRAAGRGQSAQVVIAERADDVAGDSRPIGGCIGGRRRSNGVGQGTSEIKVNSGQKGADTLAFNEELVPS